MVWGNDGRKSGLVKPSIGWIFGLCMLLTAVVLLSGCGNKTVEPAEVEEPSDVVEVELPAEPEPEPEPVNRYPLTGQAAEEEVKSRPVMVMVENSPKARPQNGLDQADLVYEILAEGDITRFVAVFQQNEPDVIGPVRSIRPYYVEIGIALDALVVHAGWSPDAKVMLQQNKVAHFDEVYGDHAYYWRDKERKMPHNLYTSIEKIRQGAVNKKYRESWNEFALSFMKEDGIVSGEAALEVTIPYIAGYQVSYRYDEEAGVYLRSMAGKPHEDKASGKQITVRNVIIAKTKHKVLDKVGRRAVDIHGPGEGYLVQQGKIQPITWELRDGVVRAYANNEELPLLPGNTWIQVVPESSNISYTSE